MKKAKKYLMMSKEQKEAIEQMDLSKGIIFPKNFFESKNSSVDIHVQENGSIKINEEWKYRCIQASFAMKKEYDQN